MLLRGIFSNFKIPIWYRYDTQLGKKEYLDIVKKIEEQGFHVVSTSCDMAKSNQSLAKSLGVTDEEPYFPNPCRPNSNIYWFYDVCHLIKVIIYKSCCSQHVFLLFSIFKINVQIIEQFMVLSPNATIYRKCIYIFFLPMSYKAKMPFRLVYCKVAGTNIYFPSF